MAARKVKSKRKQIKRTEAAKRRSARLAAKEQEREDKKKALPGQDVKESNYLTGQLRNLTHRKAIDVGGPVLDFCKEMGLNPEKNTVGKIIAYCLTAKLFDTGNPRFFELMFDRVDGKQSIVLDQQSSEEKAVEIQAIMKQMHSAGAPPFPQEVADIPPVRKKILRSRKKRSA